MELVIQLDSRSAQDMKKAHEMMIDIFKDSIDLTYYYGPVQMGVWGLEYRWLLEQYTIKVESERGFINILVYDDKGDRFYPSLVYPEARYYHFADKEEDVFQLVELTYRAIAESKIEFFTSEEVREHNRKTRLVNKYER